MRRHFPWWVLFVAFVAVPLVEVYLIVQVGQVIGAWWTILLLIASGVVGSWLVRLEGARAWRALHSALQDGRMPARELADGVLILVGGTLMITPGFITDVVGILFILPFTRPLGRRVLARVISRRLGAGSPAGSFPGAFTGSSAGPFSGPFPGAGFGTEQTRPRPGPDDTVVQGEVVDDGPEPPR